MAAIAITRGREINRPGYHVFRGLGTWNSTDTSGTLSGLPKGNVVGFRAVTVVSGGTAVSYCLDAAPTNGLVYCNGSLTVKRSAGTDSGGTMLFEVSYDSN